MFRHANMRVKFWDPNFPSLVFDFGSAELEKDRFVRRLDNAVMKSPELFFFLVAQIETTDVFEPEMNYNTIAWMGFDGVIHHTYDPECPPGCEGQFEKCVHREG